MKQTITESYFIDQIVGDEYNNMSYEGAKALFEWYESYEQDETEVEFDKVAIRCEWSEYENLEEVMADYEYIENLRDLEYHTLVIEVPDTDRLIIQQF